MKGFLRLSLNLHANDHFQFISVAPTWLEYTSISITRENFDQYCVNSGGSPDSRIAGCYVRYE